MTEFFAVWRRKFGCMTLMLALLAMVGWVRSQSVSDEIVFHSGRFRTDSLLSSASTMIWNVKQHPQFPSPDADLHTFNLGSTPVRTNSSTSIMVDPTGESSEWKFCGIERFDTTLFGVHLTWLSISYWYIITPLTLLSAFLLLTKPNKPTQNKITEPAASEGRARS